MFIPYKLPHFLDFLHYRYTALYQAYAGRLTELFPSWEATERNLMIAETDFPNEGDDERIYQLWGDFSVPLSDE